MDEIDRLKNAEDDMYKLARTQLGSVVSLAGEASNLYDLFGAAVKDSKVPPRDEVVTGVRYLAQCQYHLNAGGLTLLRGHVRDSFAHLRQAIEGCGFARRIKRHPHLARVWVHDSEVNGPKREEVREKFSPGKLFPEDDSKLSGLKERWDTASMMGHSSFPALAKSSMIQKSQEHVTVSVKYFDLEEGAAGRDLIRHLLYMVQTHLRILRVFEDVLPEAVRHLGATWDARWKEVEAKLKQHSEVLRPNVE